MNNNDVLRRLRYALKLNDAQLVAIFALSGVTITEEEVRAIMGREEDPKAVECTNFQLAAFLDGLIIDRRGPRDGPPPPEMELTNNEVLKKIRIALTLRVEDIVAIMGLGGHKMSKSEVTALFRKPGNRQFRTCGGQALRKFLAGLTKRMHET